MSLKLYAIGEIYVSAPQAGVSFTKLAEEASMQVNRKTNSQIVATVHNGYSGESPGAAMCEIDIVNAVPAAGFELKTGKIMDQLAVVEFTIQVGTHGAGSTLVFNGFIIEDSFSHAVNTESKLTFKARGVFSKYNSEA